MAQYRLSVNIIGRSAGRSATGAAAYRAGAHIVDERTGLVHDYTRKRGVLHTEILTPPDAPDWMRDRAQLWNAVEAVEKRKDAQLSREVQLSLPHELTQPQQEGLVRRFVQDQFVAKGMIADIAIHAPSPHEKADERNVHAHIMLTMRELAGDGFGKKAREWNDKDVLEDWRADWALYQNNELAKRGHADRVDHRSLEAQGIFREPQQHYGPTATEMMRRGKPTRQQAANDDINRRNGLRADLENTSNLIDGKIAFEKRKFEAWKQKKRGQLDIDRKQRMTKFQLGLAVRMQALEDAMDEEFGDTRDDLTAQHERVADSLSVSGLRRFLRDITKITARDKKELQRIEDELERVRKAKALKRQQAQEQEAARKAALLRAEKAKSDALDKGIQKAQKRREASDWASLPSPADKRPQRPPEPLPETFQRAGSQKRGDEDESGEKSGDERQNQALKPKRSAVDAFKEKMQRPRDNDRDRER